MADISISKDHSVDIEVLRGRLEELAKDLQQKYGIRYKWNQNTIELDGTGIKSATLVMTENNVSIEITLGMMGKILKPKIEEEINNKVYSVLS